MQQVSICTGSGQTGNQAILEHIGATTSVLTDDDTSGVGVTIALTQCVVVPAQKTTNLIGMVSSQSNSSLPTEAISSKILSHYSFSLIQRVI